MALFYVAHKFGGDHANLEKAKQITHDLQVKDTQNTYICPLMALSHMEYGELDFDTELEICKDMLTVCDKLIVGSEVSKGVQIEIDFANLVGMEIEYLDTPNT